MKCNIVPIACAEFTLKQGKTSVLIIAFKFAQADVRLLFISFIVHSHLFSNYPAEE